MQKPDLNGPSRELDDHRQSPGAPGDFGAEQVYCVNCGTVFISAHDRDCPSCTNAAAIEQLQDRVDELEKIVDRRLDEISEDLQEVKRTTGILAEVQEGGSR